MALNCPGCGTKVADGTSICPKCDYIIDASFLSAEPPSGNADDDSTAAGEDPRKAAPAARPARTGGTGQRPSTTGTRRAVTGSTKPVTGSTKAVTGSTKAVTGSTRAVPGSAKPATGSRPAVSPRSATGSGAPAAAAGTRPGARTGSRPAVSPAARRAPESPSARSEPEMELDDSEVRKPIRPPPSASRGYATTNASGTIVAPEQFISDTRAFVRELGRSDKLAFTGASAVIVSCFLPWKETATDGDVLGLMSMGVGAVICAAIIISALFIRVRRTMPNINPAAPWMTQLGVSVLCVLYTLIFITAAFDATEVPSAIGNAVVRNSTPSLGAFIGLLGAIGALVGSVMGMKERR